jgi:hypothetical protein
MVGLGQQIFYQGIDQSDGGIALKKVTIPTVELGAIYRFWRVEKTHADFDIRGLVWFPGSSANFKTKTGGGVSSAISITRDFDAFSLRSGFFYRYAVLNTTILQLRRRDLGLDLGFEFTFD